MDGQFEKAQNEPAALINREYYLRIFMRRKALYGAPATVIMEAEADSSDVRSELMEAVVDDAARIRFLEARDFFS